jgi:hypothetical protein
MASNSALSIHSTSSSSTCRLGCLRPRVGRHPGSQGAPSFETIFAGKLKLHFLGRWSLSRRGHPAACSAPSPRNQYIRAGRVQEGMAECPRRTLPVVTPPKAMIKAHFGSGHYEEGNSIRRVAFQRSDRGHHIRVGTLPGIGSQTDRVAQKHGTDAGPRQLVDPARLRGRDHRGAATAGRDPAVASAHHPEFRERTAWRAS